MHKSIRSLNFFLAILISMVFTISTADAYGSREGGRQVGCKGPSFKQLSPAKDSVVSEFSDFSAVIFNADKKFLVVKLNGSEIEPEVVQRGSGALVVTGSLESPVTEAGFVTVSLRAKARGGKCPKRLVYRVKVEPNAGDGSSTSE